jgi:ATPase subunit of ABC transporter with duplicated ATPase domains
MAHIVRFHIEGLAGKSEPVSGNLNKDDNIFFGVNGSGKTSLLKILHSAMSNDTQILQRVPFTLAEVEIYSIDYDKTFKRTLKKPKKYLERLKTRRRHLYTELEYRDVYYIEDKELDDFEWKNTPTIPKDAVRTR